MTAPLRVDGVDISHHQGGQLDMPGAKRRGLKWLYHKATEGTSLRDSNYAARRAEADRAGLPFGAYHFARPDLGDAVKEARFFLDVARPKPGDLRCALDLETTEGLDLAELRRWAATWISVVRKATGARPVIYTPFDLGAAEEGCYLWRPRYNNDNRPPVLPWDIFQFSNGVLGVPNRLAGIGNVDLNHSRVAVNDLLIPKHKDDPKPPKPEPKTRKLRIAHISMQFSDSAAQHQQDVDRLFDRAVDRGYAWITGTEAGPGAKGIDDKLRKAAREHGYRFFIPKAPTDAWIAVSKDLVDGGWDQGYDPVIPGSGALGGEDKPGGRRWGPKGLVRVAFDNDELGRIHVGAAHYLTGGRRVNETHGGVNHWAWNKKLGQHIGDWAVQSGRGAALVFYGGDQNMADSRNDQPQGDTFFGRPLTSLQDELKRWENTGHGPIDVLATYDRDARVTAKRVNVLNDKEFPLHTDHFLVEGVVEIKLLKG